LTLNRKLALLCGLLLVESIKVLLLVKLEDFLCSERLPDGHARLIFGHEATPHLLAMALIAWPSGIGLADEIPISAFIALEYNFFSCRLMESITLT